MLEVLGQEILPCDDTRDLVVVVDDHKVPKPQGSEHDVCPVGGGVL